MKPYSVPYLQWDGPLGRTPSQHPCSVPIPSYYQQSAPVLRAVVAGGRFVDWPIPQVRAEEVSAAIRGWTDGIRVCMACRDRKGREEVAPVAAALLAEEESKRRDQEQRDAEDRVVARREAARQRETHAQRIKDVQEAHAQRIKDVRAEWGPVERVLGQIDAVDRKLATVPTNLRLGYKGWFLVAVLTGYALAIALIGSLPKHQRAQVPLYVLGIPALLVVGILTYGWSRLALGRPSRVRKLREDREALHRRLGCGDVSCSRCRDERSDLSPRRRSHTGL